jgi:hypothetical protein
LTVGELRREIIRCEREIFRQNWEGERELEENEQQGRMMELQAKQASEILAAIARK